jgi:hypothetical protein
LYPHLLGGFLNLALKACLEKSKKTMAIADGKSLSSLADIFGNSEGDWANKYSTTWGRSSYENVIYCDI